jgi:putative transposase
VSRIERMLAGVSCRRYERMGEPVGAEVAAEARGLSKSAISRTFIERTRQALSELMARRLDEVRLAVPMLDGIELKGRTKIVALGISTEGVKIPLYAVPSRAATRWGNRRSFTRLLSSRFASSALT